MHAETVLVPRSSISDLFQVSLLRPRTSNNLSTLVNTHNSMHDFEIETSIPFLISVQVSFLCLDIFLNSAATLKKKSLILARVVPKSIFPGGQISWIRRNGGRPH